MRVHTALGLICVLALHQGCRLRPAREGPTSPSRLEHKARMLESLKELEAETSDPLERAEIKWQQRYWARDFDLETGKESELAKFHLVDVPPGENPRHWQILWDFVKGAESFEEMVLADPGLGTDGILLRRRGWEEMFSLLGGGSTFRYSGRLLAAVRDWHTRILAKRERLSQSDLGPWQKDLAADMVAWWRKMLRAVEATLPRE